MTRDEILQEAAELINGDRQAAYGPAKANFQRIADGWSVLLGVEVSPQQVALCMTWLKMARLVHQPGHKDSHVDAAAYIALAAELA